jgi:hypothetical protein
MVHIYQTHEVTFKKAVILIFSAMIKLKSNVASTWEGREGERERERERERGVRLSLCLTD